MPTILVVAGIVFWILAIAGSVAGKITVEPGKQKTAGLVGTAFIVLGLILFFAPGSTNQDGSETKTRTADTTRSYSPPVNSDPNRTRPSPGVNCSGTGTPDEVEICRSATLIDLDWQLYDVYQALLKRLDQNRQTKLAQEESVWVKQRGECQKDVGCLTAAYKSRIDQLHSAQ